jgi:hypothetical protein
MAHKDYMGFRLDADIYAAAWGFVPTLTITKHGDQTLEKQFSLPYPSDGYLTEKDAVDASLIYGMAIIDGQIKGQTVSEM